MNPLDMMRGITNPQQFIQKMMSNSQVMNNPMAKNVIGMAQNGDAKGIETMARNLCKEKGVNPEEMMDQIRKQFKM